jgi:hypothetical protein
VRELSLEQSEQVELGYSAIIEVESMPQSKKSKVAAVIGVGPGTGASLARRFGVEYAVALMARNADYLRRLGDEIRAGGGVALETPGDVGNASQVTAAFATIREQLGDPGRLAIQCRRRHVGHDRGDQTGAV